MSQNNTLREACVHNRIDGSVLRRTEWHPSVNRRRVVGFA
jgi:hypothetical protein